MHVIEKSGQIQIYCLGYVSTIMMNNSKEVIRKEMQRVIAFAILRLSDHLKVVNGDFIRYKYFEYFQRNGLTLLPNHYYQPTPDLKSVNEDIFSKPSELVGVKMNDGDQIKLLSKFAKFKGEYSKFKNINKKVDDQVDSDFYFKNLAFDGVDALVYYCMIRYLKPSEILEVGSGWSTKIAAKAVVKNKKGVLDCIEPYPQPILQKGFKGLHKLIKKKVQDVPFDVYESLANNDILFIDSSHTVKAGGDVNHMMLEVLPRLKKGVYIHIHDIFLPYDYPKEWVLKEKRFWNEQYLVHAFLIFNDSFDVVYANNYMGHKHPKEVKKVFSNSPQHFGGSLWLKKVK